MGFSVRNYGLYGKGEDRLISQESCDGANQLDGEKAFNVPPESQAYKLLTTDAVHRWA